MEGAGWRVLGTSLVPAPPSDFDAFHVNVKPVSLCLPGFSILSLAHTVSSALSSSGTSLRPASVPMLWPSPASWHALLCPFHAFSPHAQTLVLLWNSSDSSPSGSLSFNIWTNIIQIASYHFKLIDNEISKCLNENGGTSGLICSCILRRASYGVLFSKHLPVYYLSHVIKREGWKWCIGIISVVYFFFFIFRVREKVHYYWCNGLKKNLLLLRRRRLGAYSNLIIGLLPLGKGQKALTQDSPLVQSRLWLE